MSQKEKTIEELIGIIEELREKCPWDKKQTINSLRHLTIEEVYELSDAIIAEDNNNIEEELGDVLLHVLFYCLIGKEQGDFTLGSVARKLIIKLKERHPHIYGNTHASNAEKVMFNWEELKKKKSVGKGTLDNIPKGIPAFTKSMRIQEKVKTVGFDWDDKGQVLKKVEEEIDEMKKEIKKNNLKKIKGEIGDVIFSIINYARFIGVDPEEALDKTNNKFITRFSWMEKTIRLDGKSIKKMSLEEMDKYWERSKKT